MYLIIELKYCNNKIIIIIGTDGAPLSFTAIIDFTMIDLFCVLYNFIILDEKNVICLSPASVCSTFVLIFEHISASMFL
jgi:hypothetical protein